MFSYSASSAAQGGAWFNFSLPLNPNPLLFREPKDIHSVCIKVVFALYPEKSH